MFPVVIELTQYWVKFGYPAGQRLLIEKVADLPVEIAFKILCYNVERLAKGEVACEL